MLMYLDGIAVGCFVLFILLLIIRAHHIRKTGNYRNAGKFTIFLSWLLIIIFFVSISGIAYGATNPTGFNHLQTLAADQVQRVSDHHFNIAIKPKHDKKGTATRQSSSAENNSPKKVSWTPENPTLKDGNAKVTFTVPKETTVTVKGHVHHQQYGKIKATTTAKKSSMNFDYAGQYDVVINQNGQQRTATLTIK